MHVNPVAEFPLDKIVKWCNITSHLKYICDISAIIAMRENGRSVSLSQTAYQRIKKKIVSLELPPGAVINEIDLQADLQLGRTPIREALHRLSLEKLVDIVPRRGMFVTGIAVTDLLRVCEVRVEMEGLAARLATERGKPEHWQAMEMLLEDVLQEGFTTNYDILIGIDQKCHEIVYTAADNKFLENTLITMYALSLRLWYYALSQVGDVRGAILEHAAILDALKAGDADLAERLSKMHVKSFQEEIQAILFKLV